MAHPDPAAPIMGKRHPAPVVSIPLKDRSRAASRRGASEILSAVLETQIETSESGRDRILGAMRHGAGEFVLSSIDGTMNARVRVRLATLETRHDIGGARLIVDWSQATVTRGNRQTSLSRTELRLFAALLEADGHALSRASLVARVWPNDHLAPVDRENALAVYVCSLRKRLASIGAPNTLQTVRGVGYRVDL